MDTATLTTRQKALALNLDATKYGTFAEIGGGQEVSRWFFSVGGAAGTGAKTISAYDMAGRGGPFRPPPPNVSPQRLGARLEHGFAPLEERVRQKHGEKHSV